MKIPIKTAKQKFDINVFCKFVDKKDVKVEKEKFIGMCRKGCKNYDKKWCCPPFAPAFSAIAKKEGIFVVLFKTDLNQIKSTPYNKMRIANVVMKSRVEKLMRQLEQEFDTKFLSSGSCRLCNPCKRKLNRPCAHPEKMRYSLEATGVDCADIAQKLGVKLEWFPKGNSTSVVCGLICDESEKEKIEEEIKARLTL